MGIKGLKKKTYSEKYKSLDIIPKLEYEPVTDKFQTFYKRMRTILSDHQNNSLLAYFEQSEAFIKNLLSHSAIEFNEPLVSIIMPTYNRAHIIADAVTSVVEQSYINWELWICDDGSTDNTEEIISEYHDDRINYLKLSKMGAVQARNIGLSNVNGAYIAYLDTDNIWHPQFLTVMIRTLNEQGGRYCAYSKYIDVSITPKAYVINKFDRLRFSYDDLLTKNFIDLSSFIHIRETYDNLGGFNEKLTRRQDHGLILKYAFLRDPYYVDAFLMIYQRNKAWNQITYAKKDDHFCDVINSEQVDSYHQNGLPLVKNSLSKNVTVISWDICRNHFSKAYNIAECLSKHFNVQLIGFRFFEENIFPPYGNESPSFETVYLEGKSLPHFYSSLKKASTSIKGDVIYAVKPRLPSLGLALLANHFSGTPLILEINDLESVVSNLTSDFHDKDFSLRHINMADKNLRNPYSDLWSKIMEYFAQAVPIKVTHNNNLNDYFGGNCYFIRNIKDEYFYDPEKYDRATIRNQLGFSPEDRIILFGGMLRRHKGIYELLDLIERVLDPRYKLLIVGSRITPEQMDITSKTNNRIRILPPTNRNEMAKINLAADVAIVWLDPSTEASHYQMPYKLTDAFAMKLPVIANNISDMGDLGRKGYLRLVDYADYTNMVGELDDIFDKPEKTSQMVERARRLFQREFSYSSGMANFQLIDSMMKKRKREPLAVSRRFVEFFEKLK